MKEERIYMQPLTSMNELIELIGNELYDKKEANEETDKIVSEFLGIQKTNIFFNERNHFIMLWSKYKKFGIANEILGFKVIYSDEMFLLDKHFIFCRIPKTDMEMFVNEYLLKKENEQLQIENTKLKQKLEEQTKTYQKILQEQQNEIDQLERNCDVFNEQMNDAVERTVELNKEKQELKEWLEEEINTLDTIYENLTDAGAVKRQTLKEVLEKLGE